MVKVYYLISMLHDAPDVACVEIDPFDDLNKCNERRHCDDPERADVPDLL
jgi:hypothetical protein